LSDAPGDALFQSIPDIDKTLLQFTDVIHFRLVDSLLCSLATQIWTVVGHISDEINVNA